MKHIYNQLPWYLQNFAVSIAGYSQRRKRYGVFFKSKLQEYVSRDGISKEELFEYRAALISRSLEQASRTDYYAKKFREMGAHWSELADPINFSKIPLTFKSEVARDPSSFMPRKSKDDDISVSTSGTTGQSLKFRASRNFDAEQWVVWWRYRHRFGIGLGTKCALFSSTPVVPPEEKNKFWRLNIAMNEFRFSVFHISSNNIRSYVDALNKIKAPWIHGNPSAIALLAQLMLANNYKLEYKPLWLSIGSENLQEWQSRAIKDAFGVEPIQHYGLMEGVSNISECPYGSLHVDEDFAYTEFLSNDIGSSLRIVGTSFHNDAFSLLRYVTGDLAVLDLENNQCDCGCGGRVVKRIDGRMTDYITLPNGERVASLAGPLHSTSGLAEAQIFQDKTGNLTVRYVPTGELSELTIGSIEKKMRDRIGYDIAIKFERVPFVERTARGKIKLVISEFNSQPQY
jgi:phenylacetate-CoA ligase